jgi:hypothetical protein
MTSLADALARQDWSVLKLAQFKMLVARALTSFAGKREDWAVQVCGYGVGASLLRSIAALSPTPCMLASDFATQAPVILAQEEKEARLRAASSSAPAAAPASGELKATANEAGDAGATIAEPKTRLIPPTVLLYTDIEQFDADFLCFVELDPHGHARKRGACRCRRHGLAILDTDPSGRLPFGSAVMSRRLASTSQSRWNPCRQMPMKLRRG